MATWGKNIIQHLYLIQIDLAGHSRWVSELASDPDATSARSEFAERLKSNLKHYGYSRAFWAGDGGVFCSPDTSPISEFIQAIDEIYNTFDTWKKNKPNRKKLDLRITAHIDQIYTHDDPGYWYSDSYNTFLKYERVFGLTGSAVITEEIFKRMTDAEQGRWILHNTHSINGEGWKLYRDNTKTVSIERQNFVEWLKNRKLNIPGDKANDINEGSQLAKCGEAIIIAQPLTHEGFKNFVELTEEDFDDSDWAIEMNSLVPHSPKSDFKKLSPIKIAVPMTDNIYLKIFFTKTNYSFGSKFHDLVENNIDKWHEYKDYANATSDLKKHIPSILVSHNALVLVDRGSSKEYIVVCQRKVNDKQLDYYSGYWSFSFEEQFKPVKCGDEEKDDTLEDCIKRGLYEELNYAGRIEEIQIQAILIEAFNLNTGFLGYVKIRTDIDEFKRNMADAKDYAESESVVLIENSEDNLMKLFQSGDFDKNLLEKAIFLKNEYKNVEKFTLHPTSKIRIANLLWKLIG